MDIYIINAHQHLLTSLPSSGGPDEVVMCLNNSSCPYLLEDVILFYILHMNVFLLSVASSTASLAAFSRLFITEADLLRGCDTT